MADGQVKAIEIKGINRNQTKIGVEDGMMHDLINLRFRDGSWRTSGDGKRVTSFTEIASGKEYQQLYVHTVNKYKHLLGVYGGKLWWFANIDNDGERFTAQVPAQELTDIKGDMYINQTGHLITIIDGEDNFEYFIFKTNDNEYKKVKVDENGVQGSRDIWPFGRAHFNLWSPEDSAHTFASDTDSEGNKFPNYKDYWDDDPLNNPNPDNWGYKLQSLNEAGIGPNCKKTYQNLMVSTWGKATKANQFTNPFLACVAVELYDTSWVFASNPVLLWPHDSLARQHVCWERSGNCIVKKVASMATPVHPYQGDEYKESNIKKEEEQFNFYSGQNGGFVRHGAIFSWKIGSVKYEDGTLPSESDGYNSQRYVYLNAPVWVERGTDGSVNGYDLRKPKLVKWSDFPVMCCGGSSRAMGTTVYFNGEKYSDSGTPPECYVFGSDLTLTLTNTKFLEENADVIKSIGIFITKPSNIFEMEADYESDRTTIKFAFDVDVISDIKQWILNVAYLPERRSNADIQYDLMHSPFYLLRKYDKNTIQELVADPRVKLEGKEYKEILFNITQQTGNMLELESTSRMTYLPKVAYTYNNRLHIANYKAYQFHGYPLDMFQLHNHLVYYNPNTTQEAYLKGVLPHLTADTDEAHRQFNKATNKFISNQNNVDEFVAKLKEKGKSLAFVSVKINTGDGEQIVTRYIEPYNSLVMSNGGDPNFIEHLNPLLTFPDARATEMKIYVINVYENQIKWFERSFPLKPSPIMNMAYFITEDMSPIHIAKTEWNSSYWHEIYIDHGEGSDDVLAYIEGRNANDLPNTPAEQNTVEYYPNNMKVSRVNNPLFFPVDAAYGVGQSSILALMSNTIAVGTGQTGDAPLYVFCQDGVYALFVDASGEMTYMNSRILARDVLSVPRSVTPTDEGVVFVTERGLMNIAGEQVQEIGMPCEGDVEKITQPTTGTWETAKKFTFNAATALKLGNLPTDIFDGVDFLTYLNDKRNNKETLINYNHNERELMISNPNYPYSYIMDRNGNWSRRDYTADQYVNNFPTSYRVKDGNFYKVDDEGVLDLTQTIHVNQPEADNGFFAVSDPIKLDSIGFKQSHRFVVRGLFDTDSVDVYSPATVDYNYQLFGEPESDSDSDSSDDEGIVNKEIELPSTKDGAIWNEQNIQLIEPISFAIPVNSNAYAYNGREAHPEQTSIAQFDGKITITLADDDCVIANDPRLLPRPKLIARFVIVNSITQEEAYSITFNDYELSEDGKTITLDLAKTIQLNEGVVPRRLLSSGFYNAKLELSQIALRQRYTKDEETEEAVIDDDIRPSYFGTTDIEYEDGQLVCDYHITNDESSDSSSSDDDAKTLLSEFFTCDWIDENDSSDDSDSSDDDTDVPLKAKITGKHVFYPGIPGYTQGVDSGEVCMHPNHSTATLTYAFALSKYDETSEQYVEVDREYVPVNISGVANQEKIVVDFEDFLDIQLLQLENNDNQYVLRKTIRRGNSITTSDTIVPNFHDVSEFMLGSNTITNVINNFLKHIDWESGAKYKLDFLLTDWDAYVYVDGSEYNPDESSSSDSSDENDIIVFMPEDSQSNAHIELTKSHVNTPNYQFIVNTENFEIDNFKTALMTQQHIDTEDAYLGCYVFGSYDGRKWSLLGGNERKGKFTDIGCLIEHTDVKFFRVVLAGQLKGESRMDYMEMSHQPSVLNTKIR